MFSLHRGLFLSRPRALWEPSAPPLTSFSHFCRSAFSSNPIFYISSNQLAHNSTNDSWVYPWVYFPLVDHWRYFFSIISASILFTWPIHFNLFILIKDNKSRSPNTFFNFLLLYSFLQMLHIFVAPMILLRTLLYVCLYKLKALLLSSVLATCPAHLIFYI